VSSCGQGKGEEGGGGTKRGAGHSGAHFNGVGGVRKDRGGGEVWGEGPARQRPEAGGRGWRGTVA
jgi:hypothetical protein